MQSVALFCALIFKKKMAIAIFAHKFSKKELTNTIIWHIIKMSKERQKCLEF